jgi:hypothetical protein
MSEETSRAEPFAYILIVDSDKDLRESALNKISVPNCAVDVAMDENEAVHKALQHRPRLIIIKQHEPIEIALWNPLLLSMASQICRRARLNRSVRLVTHSDVAVTVRGVHCNTNFDTAESAVILKPQIFLVKPQFKGQDWRKEWYLYCARDKTMEVLSDHIPFWLGRTSYPPSYYLQTNLLLCGFWSFHKNNNCSPAGYALSYRLAR